MATRSIFKSICIRDRKKAMRLLQAMEQSEKMETKRVPYSREVSVADKEEIRLLFGEGNQ